jgi:hypothetical protein
MSESRENDHGPKWLELVDNPCRGIYLSATRKWLSLRRWAIPRNHEMWRVCAGTSEHLVRSFGSRWKRTRNGLPPRGWMFRVEDAHWNHDPKQSGAIQGVLTRSQDFVGGQYLEFHTYNSHGNCSYVYLMSISTLTYVECPYSDVLDLQTVIRAKWVTYAIFGILGPYENYTCHISMVSRNRSTTTWSFGRTLLRYTFWSFQTSFCIFLVSRRNRKLKCDESR